MIARIASIVLCGLLSACGGGAGSFSADGGQSGTGIFSSVTGNVSSVQGSQDLSGIRVSIVGTDSEAETDEFGAFELETDANGPVLLRFRRDADGLSPDADVVVPAGGTLRLLHVVLSRDSGTVEFSGQEVEFYGFVDSLRCEEGLIFVAPEAGSIDLVEIETRDATIQRNDLEIGCGDLVVGERVEVEAELAEGTNLFGIRITVDDDGEDDDGEDDDGEDDDGEDDDGEDDKE